MSHHIYTTEGFVVGSKNIGEANKYLFIFTRDLGMIGASAQGVRHDRSKLRYHVQDYSYASFSLVRGREVWRITSARELEYTPRGARAAATHRELYVRILNLLKRLIHGEEKNEALFHMMRDGFIFFEQQGGGSEVEFEQVMVFKILALLGYIGDAAVFAPLAAAPWSGDQLTYARTHTAAVVAEINRALKESQL